MVATQPHDAAAASSNVAPPEVQCLPTMKAPGTKDGEAAASLEVNAENPSALIQLSAAEDPHQSGDPGFPASPGVPAPSPSPHRTGAVKPRTPTYCYWSVANGRYSRILSTAVASARQVGVQSDFHLWVDEPIAGATCHELGPLNRKRCLFKLHMLRDRVVRLNYDYFIWIDADTFFVRKPADILRVVRDDPMHASLESDAGSSRNIRPDWWRCPLQTYINLMRLQGVTSQEVYNLNGGFWIVHHDAVPQFYDLAFRFWRFSKQEGYTFNDEPLLAYVSHMLCTELHRHTLRENSDLWATDWNGYYSGMLPDGRPWLWKDYLTGEELLLNPAIVHSIRSKDAMVNRAFRDRTA